MTMTSIRTMPEQGSFPELLDLNMNFEERPYRYEEDFSSKIRTEITDLSIAEVLRDKGNYGLLDLPRELQLNVLKLAVQQDRPLRPVQVFPGSSKFVNRDTFIANGGLPAIRAAYELAATCKSIDKLVRSECLFYKVNKFEFGNTKEMLAYLAVITGSRRAAIRSIKTPYDDGMGFSVHSFTLLSTCYTLQTLTLNITPLLHIFSYDPKKNSFQFVKGHNELLKLRGLKSFNLVYEDNKLYLSLPHTVVGILRRLPVTQKAIDDFRAEVADLEDGIKRIVTQPRGNEDPFTYEQVKKAIDAANLIPHRVKLRSDYKPAHVSAGGELHGTQRPDMRGWVKFLINHAKVAKRTMANKLGKNAKSFGQLFSP